MCTKLVHFHKSSTLWSLAAAFRMTSASWLYPETGQDGEASRTSAIMRWESRDIRKQKTPKCTLYFPKKQNNSSQHSWSSLPCTESFKANLGKYWSILEARTVFTFREKGNWVGESHMRVSGARRVLLFPRGGYRVGLFIMSNVFSCLCFFVSTFLQFEEGENIDTLLNCDFWGGGNHERPFSLLFAFSPFIHVTADWVDDKGIIPIVRGWNWGTRRLNDLSQVTVLEGGKFCYLDLMLLLFKVSELASGS